MEGIIGNKKLALARVESIAATAFASQPFEEVSIAKIAAQARCSTATIYEAYGSKVELFKEVCIRNDAAGNPPMPVDVAGCSSLQSLLHYARERIQFLATAMTVLGYQSPSDLDRKSLTASKSRAMQRNNPIPGVSRLVTQCQTDGSMRAGDPKSLAYTISAAVGFEPVMQRLYFGMEGTVDPNPIIEMVFTCLVSGLGAAELSEFLSASEDSSAKLPYPLLGSMGEQ